MEADLYNNTVLKRALSPVSVGDNTAQNTVVIDTKGFKQVLFGILTGAIADADATFAIDVKENDANSTSGATDVAADNLIGTEAGAAFQFDDDNEVRKIAVMPTKRYVFLTITPSANASAALLSVFAMLSGVTYAPVTQPES
jgi:hypothetical protein